MKDAQRLLDQFLGTGNAMTGGSTSGGGAGGIGGALQQGLGGNLGGLGGGAVAGGLVALLLGTKGGRKLGKNAVKYGGMALIGGLAYKAYRDYQSRQHGQAPASAPSGMSGEPDVIEAPQGSPFSPEKAPGGAGSFSLAILRAMISAAKADGYIDPDEQSRIFAKVDELGLGAEEKAFVMDELRSPLDIEQIVAAATSEEAAAELYAASLLAVDPDHPAEKAYLQMLAARLNLPEGLVAALHESVAEHQE